ncbi:hypothetical protein R1sor_012502 [Riccia sorocarpa]|uniref:Transposase n=1 Tax=Riccia sorocarpa TaxID=122646 RepID=A0ABD3I828_9MARC
MSTGALANHRLVKCTCNYLCKRVDPAVGHQFITARTKRKHILMDRRSELASEVALSRERLRRRSARIVEQAPIAPLPSDIIGHTIVRPASENRTKVDGRVVSGCRTTIWKYTKMATVMSSLTGLQQNPYSDAEEEICEAGDQSGAQVEANLPNVTLPSQVHVSSTLNQYFPTLDEAVYRETWKLQALLDASNVPATTQDTILKSLFGDSPEPRTDQLGREDYRGWGLGQLLRHAGSDWTGGELGLRVLRSVSSIHDVYKSAGMPKVVRWRLCIGEEGLGDPRTIALMGYWDGFQSASSVMRSTWIVGLKIINAGSSSNIPSMPVLFIPNTKSESLGKVDLLGAAIDPFIQETLRMFVDGTEVDYAYPSHLIDNTERLEKKFTLRCILVMFSGDHPAQCKFTGFCNSGWKGCRRCHLAGKWRLTPGHGVGGIVEYVENRKQYRFPHERKEMHQMREAADNIVACDTGVQRKKVSRKTGVIEKTKAYRLHKCMMFDLVRDTTYDILHLLALCLFKKFIQYLKAVTEEDEEQKKAIIRAMEEVSKKKSSSLKGRWPKDFFTRLGYFKAEECSRFIMYCLPQILYEAKYDSETTIGQLGSLLMEIARMFYIAPRTVGGWTEEMIEQGRMLLASWRIRSEEKLGANGSILEHVAVESSIPGSCVNWHSDGVVLVSTISKAKQVWELSSNYPESSLCCMKVTTQGIGVGGQRRKTFNLSRQQTSYLSRYWRTSMRLDINSELPSFSSIYKSLKAVLLRGKIFKVGDYAVVVDERQTLLGYEWNWKVRVTKLFTHSCGQKTEMFFECTWLYNIMVGDQQKVDNLSGMQLLETRERSVEADNWRPVNQLGHHFMPLLRRGDNEILALELSESRRREHLFNIGGIGFPPPYPIVNDVMLASHVPSCRVRTLDTCVIREVLEVVNTATVGETEDALSDDDSLDDTLTDASVGLSEDIPVDRGQYEFSPTALSQVRVQWLKKNNRSQWVVKNDTCCETLCLSNLHNVRTGFSEVGFRGDRSVRWEEESDV